ncbi:MAG TPA: N-acetylmuramoyl-L-alanine amidase, partial [Terriglobales bacterium]
TEAYGFNDSDVRSLSLLAELILGAMKPEEEERLESLSPVAIQPATEVVAVASSPKQSEKQKPAIEENIALPAVFAEPASMNPDLGLSSELSAPFLHKPEKSANPGMRVVVLLVAVAVILALGIWWRLHSKAMTSASAAATVPSAAAAPAPAPIQTTVEISPPAGISEEDASRNVLPVVTGIRHWESGDSTTVVIDLQDQVQYEVHRLTNPERIYFDLHDTVLDAGLSGKTIEVGDPLLIRIRVAQPVPGVSRVVLETKDVSTFSVSLEANPYRLVAEIRSTVPDSRSKAKIDLLNPDAQGERGKGVSSAQPLSKEDLRLRAHIPKMKVVIDAGHGGWDLGTVGRQGLLEKDLVLDIAQRLGDLLESRLGTQVIYTRGFDTYIPLERRAEVANQAQADLFVSIHANYSDYPSARGVETYYTNYSSPADSLEIEKRENANAQTLPTTPVLTGVALKERTEESRRLAASVERALFSALGAKNPGIRDRGVKEAGFVVLTGTTMPAILAEVSFVSSPADEYNLQSSTYRQQIADALYKGLARYAANSSRVKMASASAKTAGR